MTTKPKDKRHFPWTYFYEAIADKLLPYRVEGNRKKLIEGIHSISSGIDCLSHLQDRTQNNSTGLLEDICPFTTMGIFNRYISCENRKKIAIKLATFLGVEEVIPYSRRGIPRISNFKSRFFKNSLPNELDNQRRTNDINALWEIFAQAISFAESDDANVREDFIAAFNSAIKIDYVSWNLTIGLHWIRPWNFPALDTKSHYYIRNKLKIEIKNNALKGCCNANDYLTVLNALKTHFQEDAYSLHSFPELSRKAQDYHEKNKKGLKF